MSLKAKLTTFIVSLVAIASLIIVGVFALKEANFNSAGKIIFNAKGVDAKIEYVQGSLTNGSFTDGKVAGTTAMKTLEITSDMDSEDDITSLAEYNSWQNLKLQFDDRENGTPVSFQIKITNLAPINSIRHIDLTVTTDRGTIEHNLLVDCVNEDGQKTTYIAPNKSATFTVTFSVDDLDYNSSLTGYVINFGLNKLVPEDLEDETISEMFTFNYVSEADNTVSIAKKGTISSDLIIPEYVYFDDKICRVTTIADSGFANCSGVTTLVLPVSVTKVANNAFNGCTGIKTICYEGSEEQWENVTIGTNNDNLISDKTYNNSKLLSVEDYEFFTFAYQDQASKTLNVSKKGTPDGDLEIPGFVIFENQVCKVTHIKEEGFKDCESITGLEIPDAIISIEDNAFSGCSEIKSVNIAEGVLNIGNYAFNGCSSLSNINVPEGVKNIGKYGFQNCTALTKLTIPNSVTSIGMHAFSGCSSLIYNKINNLDEGKYLGNEINKYFLLVDTETASLTEYSIQEDCKFINSQAFYNCSSLTNVIIPEGVTIIGSQAFAYCSKFANITIPSSVTSIGIGAFLDCAMTSIIIPEEITVIETLAFSGCFKLTTITIPEGVTSIGSSAFYGCSELTSITIPNTVTKIGKAAFNRCTSLISVNIPEGVTSIEVDTFYSCSSLTSISIPNTVTKIDEDAFYGCSSLTSINIPEGVTSIGDRAFASCSVLASIIIPKDVISIGVATFHSCKALTNVTIPDSVTSIGNSAFYGCSELTSITIPKSVTSIGDSVFKNCSNLSTINIKATTPPTLGTNSIPTTVKIIVPVGASANYTANASWSSYTIEEATA